MKTENIKIVTIASSNNRKVSKEFEKMQNKKHTKYMCVTT